MKKEKWINTPWAISIGTTILSLLLTIGYDYLKARPVLTTIWDIIKWMFNLIWTLLNFDIKVWWIILAIVLFIFIIVIIGKFKDEKSVAPDFLNYKEDKFKKWKWTWEWEWSSADSFWVIKNMKAHCPNCDTSLINRSSKYSLYFDCPRCNFIASDEKCDDPYKMEILIHDNLDRRRNKNNL